MNNIEKIIEDAIQQAVADSDYAGIAELAKGLAAIKNVQNIEKTLAVFRNLGEVAKQAASQFDPAMITEMMKQGRG